MFSNYFTVCFRNLWRNKAFSFINIAGLSVGLACCMLIFLYAKDEISFDRFHKNKDKIYRIVATSTTPEGAVQKMSSTGMMPAPRFAANLPEIEDFVRLQSDGYSVRKGNQVIYQDALDVDENFFSIFSFPLLSGNPKTALQDLHSVVLSEQMAIKYFGTRDAVGKILELKVNDQFEPFTVSAVAKSTPQNSSIQIQMLLPMKFRQTQRDDKQWLNFFLNSFIVVRPGTDMHALEAKFDKVYQEEAASQIKEEADKYNDHNKIKYFAQPLLAIHLSTDFKATNGLINNSSPTYSYILTAISMLILVIACINFVNLTISRSLKRAKEIGIRKVIGGQRKQLIVQFLGESFILCFIAFLLGIVLVQLILPFFNNVANKALAFSYLFDARLVIGYLLLFLVTGLLAGFYPALILSGFNPVQTLYGRMRLGGKNYLSRALVVLQFTLATFLIIATLTIYSQFNYLMHFDLGYNDKHVAVVNTDEMNRKKYDLLRTELLNNAGVQGVSVDQGGEWMTHAQVNGGTDIMFDFKIVDENYFPLFQIPVIKGRNFSNSIASDSNQAVVVNESFVKTAGWKDPIGQTVDFFYNKKKYTVIGVIRDYHYGSLTEKIGPQIFLANPEYVYRRVYVKLKPDHIADALHHIAATHKNIFPFFPYECNFKDDQNAQQYTSEAKWKQIIGFGALLTIFISCIGLFGLATLSAEKRTKEIGIRKVLGASVPVIVRKLSGDFLALVLLAAIIAAPAALWAMNLWLQNYPYRISVGFWLPGIAISLVLLIALVTLSYQVVKAALANPVKSLRTE